MKIKFKKTDVYEWHKKFAWVPTRVSDNDDKHTIVWAESYMRKKWRGDSGWRRYSKVEYFKRELRGDFREEKDASDSVYIGGSSSVSSSTTLVGGSGISSGYASFTFDPNTGIGKTQEAVEDGVAITTTGQMELDLGDGDYTAEMWVNIPIERNYKL